MEKSKDIPENHQNHKETQKTTSQQNEEQQPKEVEKIDNSIEKAPKSLLTKRLFQHINYPSVQKMDPLRLRLVGGNIYTRSQDVLKFCKKLQPPIIPSKIACPRRKASIFIKFNNKEDLLKFKEIAQGKKLKGKKFKIKNVENITKRILKIEHDVIKMLKREERQKFDIGKPIDPKIIEEELKRTIDQRMFPYLEIDYKDQILMKRQKLEEILIKIKVQALKNFRPEQAMGFIPKWLKNESKLACPLKQFIEAHEDGRLHYRNKAEFTIGHTYGDEKTIKVGFNIGNFHKGFMFVEDFKDFPLITKEANMLSMRFQTFLNEHSQQKAYDRIFHQGFWRNFIVKQSKRTKEMLITIVAKDENFIKNENFKEIRDLQTAVSEYFIEIFKNDQVLGKYQLQGLLWKNHTGQSDVVSFDAKCEVLIGLNFYHEIVNNLKFKVNEHAFLQVNTVVSEQLYNLISKLAETDSETVLLDICSGIGTIGLVCGKNAQQIYGIEMVEGACQDAIYNIKENNLSDKYQVICGKVEDHIEKLVKERLSLQQSQSRKKIIGIVDPPRAGLHPTVIKSLRRCKGLDKLIYVSCNPNVLVDNLRELILPETKRRKAPPFIPVMAFGVDLFPQTEHFECVLLLQRIVYGQDQ